MIRSLGYRSDLAILAGRADIVERPGYLVVRTPAEPSYYWGNFLLYPQAPGELADWEADFRREFPQARHRAFGWDDPTGAMGQIEPFKAAHYEVDCSAVMATATPAQVPVPDVAVRPLVSDADWQQALELQVLCEDSGHHDPAHYMGFKRTQLQRFRAMSEAGLGHWWGAFVDDQLVADLGLFVQGGEARYQSVETHPGFRRRGICRYLVAEAARRTEAHTYVIVAEDNAPAIQVYAGAGFKLVERQGRAAWWPELGKSAES